MTKFAAILAVLCAIALALLPGTARAIGFGDAAKHGSLAFGGASSGVRIDGGALFLDYDQSRGGTAGAWLLEFPPDFGPEAAGILDLAWKQTSGDVPVRLGVELKGDAGFQAFDIAQPADARRFRATIDWSRIGAPKEVVLVVRAPGGGPGPVGSLQADAAFRPATFGEAVATSAPTRMAGAIAAALAFALAVAALRRMFSANQGARGPLHDIAAGGAIVFGVATVLVVHSIGKASHLDFPNAWLLATAFGAASCLLAHAAARSMPTVGESLLHALVLGLFAASAAPIRVWQAPEAWGDLALLSGFGAAFFAAAYIVANAVRLAVDGRAIARGAALALAAAPYAFGLLLATGSPLKEVLGARADIAACAALVFAFNELVALGVGGRPPRSLASHAVLLTCAVAVAVAPSIADVGSGSWAAGLPVVLRPFVAVAATMLSQAALWAEAYLVTALLLNAVRGERPDAESFRASAVVGARKGAAYGGILMGLLQVLGLVGSSGLAARLAAPHLIVLGALAFPLFKTIVETFDGSTSFLRRAAAAWRSPILYGRGAVVGLGAAIAVSHGIVERPTLERILFGIAVGIAASAGATALRDCIEGLRGRGGIRSWRVYVVESLLGAFVGGGLGFYLDAMQVPVVAEKLRLYASFGLEPRADDFNALLSKWGRVELAPWSGGAKLLFNESLKGVIGWGIAAWLFAFNNAALAAIFERHAGPLRRIPTRAGIADLAANTVYVLRWGLWMAPIIFTFLRQMPDPTWYNQDGAVRTVVATVNAVRMDHASFVAWSREVFMAVLAYDAFRILIWLDHMGLRVATLVNLSFIGMDRLDHRFARFIGRDAAARCIPEGVKRFATWAPLLIPFYIPAGAEWDYVWTKAEAIQNATSSTFLALLASASPAMIALCGAAALVVATIPPALLRRSRALSRRKPTMELRRGNYAVVLKPNGEFANQLVAENFDIARRAYEGIDPAGRMLFIAEGDEAWPVVGNHPEEVSSRARAECRDDTIVLVHEARDLAITVEITLVGDAPTTADLWTVHVEDLADRPRAIRIAPYAEWVLNRGNEERFHTQYNRLFVETRAEAMLNAVIARHRTTRAIGFLASDRVPGAFALARVDFIGRAESLWRARGLARGELRPWQSTIAVPAFDAAAALEIPLELPPRGTASVRFLSGAAFDESAIAAWIRQHLDPETAESNPVPIALGHGALPAGTPRPCVEFRDDGAVLRVLTPFTPRPFDHTMSNALGHVVAVTNRGLHCSASVNAQQNRLTRDWADTVGTQVPSEAIVLYDVDAKQWFAPTWHPLEDRAATCEADFGLDGTAVFRMAKDALSTELAVFVPPNDPTGVYVLTIRNAGPTAKRLRVAACFQIVLADFPENAPAMRVRREMASNALLFENPSNAFRTGIAFASASFAPEAVETRRGRFLGVGRSFARPFMAEHGAADDAEGDDALPVAAFAGLVVVPAGREATVVFALGQADDRATALATLRKYRDIAAARAELAATRRWWKSFAGTLETRTDDDRFDGYLHWLKYQALAERMWARKGFYQASGAFGFRDQLQDAVNLIWVEPSLARRQILLHAAQQFVEGDVCHWFFRLQDGRTGFASRSHASDNPMWLAWGAAEYLRMAGDASILDEVVPYLVAETPFPPLPEGKHGVGFFPHRSARRESLWRHVLRAVDLVFERRMGAHGLPLIGTGDWNDGLDEIGSQGRGESVWLGFFSLYILRELLPHVESRETPERAARWRKRIDDLREALERTWRGDRYLRALHDDGTEIGIAGGGSWELAALTVAWPVIAGMDRARCRTVFDTGLRELEGTKTIRLGTPPLRADSKPYLGRSSKYPEGVRENGMYCHGVQWLVRAARILAGWAAEEGDAAAAQRYRDDAMRLWSKIAATSHATPDEIDIYGGQPNKQAADMVTTFEEGRMIWNGYTGAAGWVLREAIEGVLGFELRNGEVVPPADLAEPRGPLSFRSLRRDLSASPFADDSKRPASQEFRSAS